MLNVTTSPSQVWQAVLGQMQVQVTGPIFTTYLKDTAGSRFDGRVFTVCAPNEFVVAQLAGKFQPRLLHELSGVLGGGVELAFEVNGAEAARIADRAARSDQVTGRDTEVAQPSDSELRGGREDAVENPPHPSGAPPLPAGMMRGDAPAGADSRGAVPAAAAFPAFGRANAPSPMPAPVSGVRLNPKYTFDTFIVGASNSFAHAAAQGVAAEPGRSYNPLFLYGGVGLGKTHLLHAIGHEALRRGLQVISVSSEQFTNDFVNSIRERQQEAFRGRYRSADVLLIDDIQFIAGKEGTQEEFFHTFNELHQHGRQIVLTSDRPPKSISLLEDRMRTRFEMGLTADITPPNDETRMAILRAKADELCARVPDAVIEAIAGRVTDNVRELEGSLNRVIAMANLQGVDITLTLAARALDGLSPAQRRRHLTPEEIIDAVAFHYNVPQKQLTGKARDRDVVRARHVAMHLLRADAALPTTVIGKLLGKRDHTTVLHATEKIEREVYTDPALRQELASIREALGSKS